MRVLFVNQCSPLKPGGAETRSREVAFRLARAGHEVTVLCGKTDAGEPDEACAGGVRILARTTFPERFLKRFPHPHPVALAAANFTLMFHLRSLLRAQSFDVVREDVAPFPPSFLLALARLPARRRIAVTHLLPGTLAGWVQHYGFAFGTAGYAMDRLLRAGVLRYDAIVCAASWLAEDLKRSERIARKVRYVPNGIDLERFSAIERRELRAEAKLLCVGRLVDTKGHRFAIEALAQLKERYPALTLDIVGKGPLEPRLIEQARALGVGGALRILPPVPHACMPALYGRYDLLLMPSTWEGQPVTLLEAIASKLPVIASDIPSISVLLDERTALLPARSDARSLADAIVAAIEQPQATRRRAEAAHRLARDFDWDVTAAREFENPGLDR